MFSLQRIVRDQVSEMPRFLASALCPPFVAREEYGTHSLRSTKAAIINKATGNLRAVQILLGHTRIETTVRYLGVDVEDA